MDELQIRAISPKLIKAYKEAIYVVRLGDREIALQVNKASLQLAKLMEEWEVPTAAFLTAFNPYSQTLDAKENEACKNTLSNREEWRRENFPTLFSSIHSTNT
ncbi:hypothetical protein G6712_02360 [Polynucleobacter paneuropaeus]|nr:hypothetical protein [Polynucleobacter paneuropaeus]